MAGNPGTDRRLDRSRSLAGGLLAALVFLAGWLPFNAPEPLLPTADLYTHLSVARHLAQGEGFRTDIAYPLSFAFPFARELPQPLVHRGPGFSLLMVAPYLAAGRDPAATVTAVRWLQAGILGLIVLTGSAAFLRQGRVFSVGPWLVFLAGCPLLVYAVDWGFEELLCGWLLLMVWLRVRQRPTPGALDGILAGTLALVRLDLFWVPVLWWLWFGWERRLLQGRQEQPAVSSRRGVVVAMILLVVIQTPWAGRNLRLTGQPFFSLQGQAELVKDTSTWPGYSVYKQLEPQPLTAALADDPVPIVRKTARGLKFFVTNLPRLVPLPYLVLCALLVVVLLRGKITHLPCPFRRGREHPMSILAEDTVLGPLAAAAFTCVLLCGQYSLFDHNLRHLLPMLPVLLWEFSPLTGDLAVGLMARTLPSWPSRPHPVPVFVASVLVTASIVLLSRVPLDGWANARNQARSAAPRLTEQVAAFQARQDQVLFVQNSALPWYAERAAVWDPDDETVREEIRRLMREKSAR
jgi:hypothetical protein